VKIIYKITYPNGRFTSAKMSPTALTISAARIVSLSRQISRERRGVIFSIRREILWESETATAAEVKAEEFRLIRHYRSNDPRIGYNRSPKLVVTRPNE
jgi:hypothetical protein